MSERCYVGCKFLLSSTDKLVLVENGPHGGVLQVIYEEYFNKIDGKRGFVEKCCVPFEGIEINSLELCEISSTSKLLVIVGGHHFSTRRGCIRIFECVPTANAVTLSTPVELSDASRITSIACDEDQELLIYANENGDVVQLNLRNFKELRRSQVDPTGIRKLKFTASKSLVWLGNSTQSSANVIDIRTPPISSSSSSSLKKTVSFKAQNTLSIRNFSSSLKTRLTSSSSSSSAELSGFVCMDTHPSLPQVMLGCHSGSVLLWDTRSTRCVEFQPHHCRVTDLRFHPLQSNHLLTSSIDGTVVTFDYFKTAQIQSSSPSYRNKLNGNHMYSYSYDDMDDAQDDGLGGEEDDVEGEYITLLSHTAAIQAMDLEDTSNTLLVVSNQGKFWRLPLS